MKQWIFFFVSVWSGSAINFFLLFLLLLVFFSEKIKEKMDLVLLDHKIISESMKLYEKEWWGTACFYICNKEMLQELLRCHIQHLLRLYLLWNMFRCKRLCEIRERLENAYFFIKEKINPSNLPVGKCIRSQLKTALTFV